MTPEFPYLSGTFCLADSSVPYFQLSLSAPQALKFLRVARELIFDPREIVLDELFQRDIDQVRVEKEIVPYLERSGEIKFFNALVVVLLPHKNERLGVSYGDSTSRDRKTTIGGIEITPACGSSGTICWDSNRICPIIVDGQHRFYALREIAKRPSRRQLEETSIPVVLLVLHEKLGFKASSESLLSTVRKVFIDLNRQAKTVSETRNILLDDRDVAAVAVRTLLEKQVKSTEHSFKDRLRQGHLPLALVDWYSDRLKFQRGVHITSILALYQCVSDLLSIPKLEQYDYEKASQWGKRFLELDSTLDYRPTIEACEQKKLPVFLGSGDVCRFEEWFRASWGPAIVHVLTTLEPYRNLIEDLRDHSFVDGPLEVWAALDRAGKAVFEKSYAGPDNIHRCEGVISEIKEDDLAFQVVVQRGILRAFTEMCQLQMASTKERATSAGTPLEYANEWVQLFNERMGSLTRHPDFWKGSAARSDGSIISSRTAEKSVSATIILSLLAPFSDWKRSEGPERTQMATDYIHLSNVQHVGGLAPWERLKATYGRVWRRSVRKFLQDTEHIHGRGESEAISRFMAQRMLMCLERDGGSDSKVPESEEKDLDDYDPTIDDLDRWI